jgi:single-stranded-DNA-specific exonuclease
MKKYSVKGEISEEASQKLRAYSPFLQHLLFHRGITDGESAEKFLHPSYDLHTYDPFLLKDMEKVVERILSAIAKKEKIIFFTDYDADGIPGGVILHDFFKKIGYKNFQNYIPHRHDEGFGLNMEAVEEFSNQGVTLLITVDCGITDIEEVKKAKERGIDVIITDHHIPGDVLPPAFAILNPKQQGCQYPEKMLCGSGVVFKMVQGILQKMRMRVAEGTEGTEVTSVGGDLCRSVSVGWEKWLLDMVGIATLSDMVPLTGENRVFGYYGLKVLRKSPRFGLAKLLRMANIDQRYLTEEDIGFTISPRINAASRMGIPMDAFRLFATQDEAEAGVLAEHLNKINDERKGIVASMVKEMKKTLALRKDNNHLGEVIVIGNPAWRPALLGLAANTLMQEHGRPVFLWGTDGEAILKGSCRSDSVSLIDLMKSADQGTFLQFGGHAFSGGFSVARNKAHLLEEELIRSYEKIRSEPTLPAELIVDKKLLLEDVTWENYSIIEKLAPYGVGNIKPKFLFEAIAPAEVKHFGKEKNHLELIFKNDKGKKISAIGFFMKDNHFEKKIQANEKINLVATIEKSFFRNFPELRLRIVDVF